MAVASRSAVMVTLVRAHLTWMASSTTPVSFERGFERQPVTRLVARAVYRRSGETRYFRLPVEGAPAVLDKAGWTVDRVLTAPDLRSEFLDETPMPVLPATSAFIATATR